MGYGWLRYQQENNQEIITNPFLLQVVFDLYVLGVVVWNAMDRPRLISQRLPGIFKNDGVFFLAVSYSSILDFQRFHKYVYTGCLGYALYLAA